MIIYFSITRKVAKEFSCGDKLLRKQDLPREKSLCTPPSAGPKGIARDFSALGSSLFSYKSFRMQEVLENKA